MKKLLSVLLCISFIIIYIPAVRAAEIFAAPKVRLTATETAGNDIAYSFAVDCGDAAGYEAERRALYEKLRTQYSDAMLIAAGEGWVTYETQLLVLLETGGYTVYVGDYSVTDAALTLTLNGDILPALARTRLYRHTAFDFTLSFAIVLDTGADPTFASPEVSVQTLSCPATAHITYEIAEDAANPNPEFLVLPYADLTLKNPTRPGYTFAGWNSRNGFVNTVPANTEELTLTAEWTPRTYKINYVLTTRPGYFVYVDNSANPLTRTYGVQTRLYDIKPPYGYLFCGWFTDPGLTGEPVTRIPADTLGDVILYAKWLTQEEKDAETVAKAHWGDPDGDGEITVKDARFALRTAVGLETPTKAQSERLDYYGTGKVTAATARQTLRFALGLDRVADILKLYGKL